MLRLTQYKSPPYGAVTILEKDWDNVRLERAAVKEAVRKQGRCGHLTLGQIWDCHPASESWPTSHAGVPWPPRRYRPRTAKQIELARVVQEELQLAADREAARLKQEAEWRAIERECERQATTQELVARAQEAIKRAERIQANAIPANRVDPRLAWQIANHQRKNGGR